jgi:MFS family permease
MATISTPSCSSLLALAGGGRRCAVDRSWRILAPSGVSSEAGDDQISMISMDSSDSLDAWRQERAPSNMTVSAFALGMIISGIFAARILDRIGMMRGLWEWCVGFWSAEYLKGIPIGIASMALLLFFLERRTRRGRA